MGEHGENENDGFRDVEEQPYGKEDDPFGSLEDATAAGDRCRLGPGPRIRHDGHSDRGEECHHRGERICPPQEIDGNAKHYDKIRVAVEDGVEETSERGHHVRTAGHGAIEEVEKAGDHEKNAGKDKPPRCRGKEEREERKEEADDGRVCWG